MEQKIVLNKIEAEKNKGLWVTYRDLENTKATYATKSKFTKNKFTGPLAYHPKSIEQSYITIWIWRNTTGI